MAYVLWFEISSSRTTSFTFIFIKIAGVSNYYSKILDKTNIHWHKYEHIALLKHQCTPNMHIYYRIITNSKGLIFLGLGVPELVLLTWLV